MATILHCLSIQCFATCLRVLSLLQVVDEIAETPSKRMRNKIAGFVTVITYLLVQGDGPK